MLVTGGAGAFGQKLINYLRECSPSRVVVLSRDEMKHAALKRRFGSQTPWLTCRIADITHPQTLTLPLSGIDVVIHAAAMKHLPECEANVCASNHVNVHGTENVIRAFQNSDSDTLIFLSTDKAPYASSVYGAQKYIGEKLITEAAAIAAPGKKVFNLRYSNVIDSTGAAFHIFGDMLKAGKKVTVNGSQTVRGFVTQAEVISCIETALMCARGGETIVLRPRVIRISELATTMCDLIGKGDVEVKETTSFVGEKDSATLIMAEERSLTKEFPEAEVGSYLIDNLSRHTERERADFDYEGPFTLEHCEILTGKALKDYLLPVMKSNELM